MIKINLTFDLRHQAEQSGIDSFEYLKSNPFTMFYNLSIGAVILRFYLMMGVVILAGFTGQWWLSILALPILLSIMTGFTLKKKVSEQH